MTDEPDKRFTGRALSDRVIDILPDDTFRLLFVLVRFGGLTFDEAMSLEWSDVNWEDCQLAVRERRCLRLCSITAEIEELLREAREARKPATDRVLNFEIPALSVKLRLRQSVERILGEAMPQAVQMLRIARLAELATMRR